MFLRLRRRRTPTTTEPTPADAPRDSEWIPADPLPPDTVNVPLGEKPPAGRPLRDKAIESKRGSHR